MQSIINSPRKEEGGKNEAAFMYTLIYFIKPGFEGISSGPKLKISFRTFHNL